MSTLKYKDFEQICKALGLENQRGKKGNIWKGFIGSNYIALSVHIHAEGRDIKNGLLNTYAKQLGFSSTQALIDYSNTL